MHSDKKLTKEDTWSPADLKRYVRDGGPGAEYIRKVDEKERRHRGGDSTERRHREPEKDKHRERDSTRERRRPQNEEDRHLDRRKEGSRDRRGDRDERDREKRRERDRAVDENKQGDRDKRERRREREEKPDRERDGEERSRDKEKERDRDKRREERERERRREERDKEHKLEKERRRHEESGDGQQRDRHRERSEKERRERHGDRKYPALKEERGHKEERRLDKEEKESRHKERENHDEKRRHDGEPREQRDSKGSDAHHRGDRERAEGNKHRERSHREEDERGGNHRDRVKESDGHRHGDRERVEGERRHREEDDRERTKTDSSKRTASDQSHRREATETEVASDVTAAEEQDYEDDFEDYEEDFEELDESGGEDEEEEKEKELREPEEREELTPQRKEEIKEMKAIRRAMDEENERVGTSQARQRVGPEEEDGRKWSRESEKKQSRASQRGKFIDFVSAKQREVSKKVASKQKKRSAELLRLIDLDFSLTFSLLDLPPVSEYDMYIKTFGTANTKQAYVQCNEDNADRDIQTEETEACEKWTQHPAEINGACGDPSVSQEAGDKGVHEWKLDSQRLTAFIRAASQVMVVLLEEDQAERKSMRKPRTQGDSLSFSDGNLQLNTKLPFLYGHEVSLVYFSQVQRHTMMSVHRPTSTPSAVRLDSCTVICIWNIWEPSKPQKILVYESEVRCCCFSPGKATLVFAGTSVGSVALWDLRERDGDHYRLKIGDEEWTLRQPTFSTDAVLAGSGHFSSVSSVEVVPSTAAGGLRPADLLLASEEESSGLSFQLASLDENGVLNFWVVVELPKASEAGSQTDLGLRPGGKVKLLHSSSLLTAESISPRDVMNTGTLQTLHLKFLPNDSNQFFIGTNMGLVTHGTTHGLKAPPKFYGLQEAGARPVDVTSIHFSPFRPNLFLVGCGDGSVRLHSLRHEDPVAEWRNGTGGEAVVCLQWTQTRPSVFCVLDAASNLHIWDLLKSDSEPVVTERMTADRVTAMAVFGDSGQQNTFSGISLAYESGKIEMQYFTRGFTSPAPDEEEKLQCIVEEAF
ncbi:cytoplasmic dynein 2 intermediate chain 1 [Genypterus blacodes]|uniref:cytoplasmic dynein 2 intermediate chain 1 n=1 Tax=Genypterus blacodes TaxID=154954 RepID=UPI003F76A926